MRAPTLSLSPPFSERRKPKAPALDAAMQPPFRSTTRPPAAPEVSNVDTYRRKRRRRRGAVGGRWRSGGLRDRNTGNPFGCQQGQRRLSFARPIPMAVHKAQALDRHLLGGVSITSMFFPLNFLKNETKLKIKIHFNHWGTFIVFYEFAVEVLTIYFWLSLMTEEVPVFAGSQGSNRMKY